MNVNPFPLLSKPTPSGSVFTSPGVAPPEEVHGEDAAPADGAAPYTPEPPQASYHPPVGPRQVADAHHLNEETRKAVCVSAYGTAGRVGRPPVLPVSTGATRNAERCRGGGRNCRMNSLTGDLGEHSGMLVWKKLKGLRTMSGVDISL